MNKERIILLLLFFSGMIVNWLILGNIKLFFLREIITSTYLLLVPGILLSWIIYPKYKNIWELIYYSLGFSLTQLMLLGLTINWILPYFKIFQPLTLLPILLAFDVVNGLLWIYLFIRTKPFPLESIKSKLSKKAIPFIIFPILFPILSTIGAVSLNNNQTNVFTMVMLGLIAFYILLLTIIRDKINEHFYSYSVFMIGLSLLLMTSLRGWFITGHDIYLEYYVFQLTKTQGIWNMASFPNPYTACLSITILPTMLSVLTHISDMYIFKILFQIIFAVSTIVTYQFLKKFIAPFLAFFGTFIIISLPTFMTDMPMLNRQEIAFLYFALMLNAIFTKNVSAKTKWLLFSIFGIGLTVSHYSTTYITIGLFIVTSIIYISINVLRKHTKIKSVISTLDKKLGIDHNKTELEILMVILLLFVTIAWNFSITHTADGIIQTINSITKDFNVKHFTKPKSDPASYSLIGTKKLSVQELLQSYTSSTTQFSRKFNNDSAFLNKDIYKQYKVSSMQQATLPQTWIGNILNKYHFNIFLISDSLKQIYAKIIQIFIIVGFLSIFWYKKHIKNLKKEHLLLTIVFFLLLVVETVLPSSAINYGILRLFQQGLILLAIPLLIGALSLFSIFDKIHKSIKIYLISSIFIFFFLFLSGFTTVITGGYYPQLNLTNSGFYYDAYYTHTQEIASIKWLVINRDKKIPIQSDWFTGKKIHTYGNIYSVDGLIPSVIRRNSYVYLSYSNIQTGEIIVYVNGTPIYYKFPFTFLDQNKSLIYNNGSSKIYR
ncbi:MAG TPA: DUF2206 domain-containing protein [Candidatus Sulfotelmatobacter sp.]|jgi:uncharacterized membrane protein|nr:DUF2206 domain-containing protein [Candidatus Sulfotelmatobacter sp.]